jgi:hypothetical protein
MGYTLITGLVVGLSVYSEGVSASSGDVPPKGKGSEAVTTPTIQQQIQAIGAIKSATVVIDWPGTERFIGLTESTLRTDDLTCTYTTQDRVELIALAKVIRTAHIRRGPQKGDFWALHEGVFLTLDTGVEMKFLLDQSYANQAFVMGSLNGRQIAANHSLPENLYRWVAQVDSPQRCESFIARYRKKK